MPNETRQSEFTHFRLTRHDGSQGGQLAAVGLPNAVIATGLGLKVDTVRKWRARFATSRLDGLKGRPRSGRPRHFTAIQSRRSEGDGLSTACHLWGPVVEVELPGVGRRGRRSRDRTGDVTLHGAPDPDP